MKAAKIDVLATVLDRVTGRVAQVLARQAAVYAISFNPKDPRTEPFLRQRRQLQRYRGTVPYGELVA